MRAGCWHYWHVYATQYAAAVKELTNFWCWPIASDVWRNVNVKKQIVFFLSRKEAVIKIYIVRS